MQVYDLDKTQEWLNKTIQLSRTPPVRGGVRTDHRARRQTLAGLLLFVGLMGSVLWISTALRNPAAQRQALPPSVEPIAAAAPAAEQVITTAPPSVVPSVATVPYVPAAAPHQSGIPSGAGWTGFSFRSQGSAGQGRTASRGRASAPRGTFAAPPAPVWLDGK